MTKKTTTLTTIIVTTTISKPTLICVLGATASGKTKLAIDIARKLNTEIISADSRQFFKEMSIGTAKPTEEELSQAQHHFIGHISIHQSYSAGEFAADAKAVLNALFKNQSTAVLVGGSGMYVQALTQGLDSFPEIPDPVRQQMKEWKSTYTVEELFEKLQQVDPLYSKQVDRNNPQRILRALEVFETAQKPYSEFLSQEGNSLPYSIKKVAIDWPRELLYQRINQRVSVMQEMGLVDEVAGLIPHKNLNALQTVGYREVFDYLEGKSDLEMALNLVRQNSRRYAKRQLTWLRNKESNITWVSHDKTSSFVKEIHTWLT